MICVVYDSECNSLDTKNGFIQELAWACYETTNWRLLWSKSYIINWPTSYQVDPEALAITGLDSDFCRKYGAKPFDVFSEFLSDIEKCDLMCGHNALAYDKPMLETNFKRAMLFNTAPDSAFNTKIHLDTMLDCEFPSNIKMQSLRYLAYDHGFILSDAHQALADVFACAHILKKYDLERMIEIAKTPVIKIRSKIEWEDMEGRDKIKRAKFYWNPTLKVWEKSIREFFLGGIQLQLGSDRELGIVRDL